MCNAMANWAWGTEYDDKDRFKLIHDELTVNGMEKFLGCSVTYKINAYFLNVKNKKFKGKKIVIIDTPGFAGKFNIILILNYRCQFAGPRFSGKYV